MGNKELVEVCYINAIHVVSERINGYGFAKP